MTARSDLTNQIFGRLTVICFAGTTKHAKAQWYCHCACGNRKIIRSGELLSGRTLSCGYLRREHIIAKCRTHGMTHSRLYVVWTSMHQRCKNRNNNDYKNYGGRGITVCERWDDFSAFLSDMGLPPPGMSIERIDNNLGYSPENCTWAPQKNRLKIAEDKMNKQTLQQLAHKLLQERIEFQPIKNGDFQIKRELYPAGSIFDIVSPREAYMSGLPITKYIATQPTYVHELNHTIDGKWMSDTPAEIVQMWRDLAAYASGRVLIGGLGLGVLPIMLQSNNKVKSITVVERSREVIQMVQPHLHRDTRCIREDIYRFATADRLDFDCALLDTWQGDNETTWLEEVVPLRRAIGAYVPRIHCWVEGVMRGQVKEALLLRASMDAELQRSLYLAHYYTFRSAAVEQGIRPAKALITKESTLDTELITEIRQTNAEDAVLQRFVSFFLNKVGPPDWEAVFGQHWDRVAGQTSAKQF